MDLQEKYVQDDLSLVKTRYHRHFGLASVFWFLFYSFLFAIGAYFIIDSYFLLSFKFGDGAASAILGVSIISWLLFLIWIHRRHRSVLSHVPQKQVVYSTLGEVLDPVNMVLILSNILIFVIIQTLFFWFVASNNIIESAKDLTDLGVELTKESGTINGCQVNPYNKNAKFRAWEELVVNKDKVEEREKEALEQKRLRNDQNRYLVGKYIFPFVLVLLFLIGVNLYRASNQGRKFTKIEAVLLLAIFAGFLTELSFYGLVVRSVTYIGEFEALSEFRAPFSTREYSSLTGPYYSNFEETTKFCPK